MNVSRIPHALLAIVLATGCVNARSSVGSAEGARGTVSSHAESESVSEIIGSRAELDAYLAANETTPLDALSPPAKERFLRSLEFKEGRLVHADLLGDLSTQMNREEGIQILRLFGAEPYARTIYPEGHVPEPRYKTETEVEQRYAALRHVERSFARSASDAERARQMAEAFDRLFPDPAEITIAGKSVRNIRAHLKAVDLMGPYAHSRAGADEVLQLFHALEQAGAVLPRDAERAQGGLIIARRFEEAAELAGRYSHLEEVPAFRRLTVPTERSLWVVEEGPALTQVDAPMPPGPQLMVTSHPHCGPSAQLLEDAMNDEELKGLLSGALWLVPTGARLSTASIAAWNERAPWASLHLVNAHAEWPEITYWGTPTFYFVKDGDVLEKVVGWIPGESRGALMSAAQRLGLLEGAAR